MRNWREIFKSLTSSPRGFSADGRTIGVGLATALAKQRRDAHLEVEAYLRRSADDAADQRVETSA